MLKIQKQLQKSEEEEKYIKKYIFCVWLLLIMYRTYKLFKYINYS